jgi:hypothetical protein
MALSGSRAKGTWTRRSRSLRYSRPPSTSSSPRLGPSRTSCRVDDLVLCLHANDTVRRTAGLTGAIVCAVRCASGLGCEGSVVDQCVLDVRSGAARVGRRPPLIDGPIHTKRDGAIGVRGERDGAVRGALLSLAVAARCLRRGGELTPCDGGGRAYSYSFKGSCIVELLPGTRVAPPASHTP